MLVFYDTDFLLEHDRHGDVERVILQDDVVFVGCAVVDAVCVAYVELYGTKS